jgi:hypothetical protein
MTPAKLMTACCDPHTAPAFKNDFWVITQEELERFHRRAQAQALRDAAKRWSILGTITTDYSSETTDVCRTDNIITTAARLEAQK